MWEPDYHRHSGNRPALARGLGERSGTDRNASDSGVPPAPAPTAFGHWTPRDEATDLNHSPRVVRAAARDQRGAPLTAQGPRTRVWQAPGTNTMWMFCYLGTEARAVGACAELLRDGRGGGASQTWQKEVSPQDSSTCSEQASR